MNDQWKLTQLDVKDQDDKNNFKYLIIHVKNAVQMELCFFLCFKSHVILYSSVF